MVGKKTEKRTKRSKEDKSGERNQEEMSGRVAAEAVILFI